MSMTPIDVRDLLGHPGATRQLSLRGTVEGLGTELTRVPDDRPIECELLLESLVEGILVSGRLRGTWELRCARCLAGFEGPFSIDVAEMYVAGPDDDPDAYALDPQAGIDLEPMVRDAVGVELPFSPLCRPDCLGLCEICGGNRNEGGCPGHETLDPRFAVLSELFPNGTSGDPPGDV